MERRANAANAGVNGRDGDVLTGGGGECGSENRLTGIAIVY